MNYDSQNDGLVNLLDFANNLGIVGIRKEIKPDDFPNIEDVTLGQLYIDEKYQRLLNETMIKKAGILILIFIVLYVFIVVQTEKICYC